MSQIGDIDWAAAQAAVSSEAARVAGLVRSINQPEAPALGEWNVIQLATHLANTLDGITAMANGGGGLLDDIWDLSKLTGMMVAGEGGLSPAEIAERIESGAANLLGVMASSTENAERKWLVSGLGTSLSSLTCHALNELVVHGRDLAVAEHRQWPVNGAYAALVVEGFLFPALGMLGRSMVDEEGAKGVKACLEIKVRGGGRAYFNFDHGDMTITAQSSGRVDCHLSVDPTAFLLVAWGRISQWKAIPKGQLLAWGRKPWLALKLRSMLRNP